MSQVVAPTPSEELIQRAKDLLIARQEVSVSLLQRNLKLGYGSALSLMAILADRGVVSGPDTEGRRTLLESSEPTNLTQ